jgi:hypothetical protein
MKFLESNPDVLMKVIPDKISLHASKNIRTRIKKNRMGMKLPSKEKKSFGIKKFSGNTPILKKKTPSMHNQKRSTSHKNIEMSSQRTMKYKQSSKHPKCPK